MIDNDDNTNDNNGNNNDSVNSERRGVSVFENSRGYVSRTLIHRTHTAYIPPITFTTLYLDHGSYINQSAVRQRHLRVEPAAMAIWNWGRTGREPCFSKRKISLCHLTNEINITGANKARVKAGQISNTISVKTVTSSGCPSVRPSVRDEAAGLEGVH